MRPLAVLLLMVGCVVSSPQIGPHPYLLPQHHLSHHWIVPAARTNPEAPQLFNHQGQPIPLPYFPTPNADFPLQHLQAIPQASAPVGISTLNQPFSAVKYNHAERVHSSLSPLLRMAVDSGVVRPAGSSHTGAPQYIVSPSLAEEAGGVSSLAYRLGAVPVAAVHDVQMRPNFQQDTESAYAPVLIHQERPEVTLYTLEVPFH